MRKLFTLAGLLMAFVLSVQTGNPVITRNIRMLKDSIVQSQLISGLNAFLIAVQESNEQNKWVLPAEKLETYLLLDEMKDIGRLQQDNHFFKPYLTNIAPIDSGKYWIQLSYIGINQDTAYLRASFDIIAVRNNDSFLFSSPLIQNTQNWKSEKTGDCIFHFSDNMNREQAALYAGTVAEFDGKIQSPVKTTEIYSCENAVDVLKLIGVSYKLDYNGLSNSAMYVVSDHKMIILQGFGDAAFNHFDPHDLFHSRANYAIPENTRNHYMICGCAYLYGGSWGMSWEEIRNIFQVKMVGNKKIDWLKLYDERYNFGESQEKHLLVTQMINALIIRKVEREKGFDTVMELLASGNFLKEREHFFYILEKITGINEKNFNKQVSKLIMDEYRQDKTSGL